ncbi:conserved hypothetical protein [Nitrobacter hamburgensis X14]|uniref:DUF2793 domain-containing protein n=1 Tax=Nitrobacter hamburgensis (strain DSM 10229 / NCIMB 13809 / X14) TaxID=323097 RepID=Q1QNE8_NITHX|nr:DUF2793 domain-containing protein [Nitrobacter hamburgensis]ABE62249.1 conserved hypothetical protein [Nitrobacter hamburgensis X14]
MTDTANLGLPYIDGSQAQKHVTHNEALRILDAAIQIGVLDLTLSAPPSTPAGGERHVVASGATGAWAGRDNTIATWQDGAWAFLAPKTGWCIWSAADSSLFVFDGAAWQSVGGTAPFDNVAHFGVNTAASSPNLLSVTSNAALFAAIDAADGGTGDMRLQVSKESPANTASIFFSDNFSGRAEFGLVGADAFKLKVSADGSNWLEAMVFDAASGRVSFPVNGGPRDVLAANRIYYVRTDGSDGNDGLSNSSGRAFLTIQKAIDAAAAIDLSIHDVTVQLADGTYTGAVVFKTLTGAGRVIIKGNATTPSNTFISVTGADAFSGVGFAGSYQLNSLKIQTATSGNALNVQGKGAYVELANVDFGAAAGVHIRAALGATVNVVGNYAISGGAGRHWNVSYQGLIYSPSVTITLTGTPAFSSQFAIATSAGVIECGSVTYSGAATGTRYSAISNGVISSSGGTLPGNAAGSTASGGQFV